MLLTNRGEEGLHIYVLYVLKKKRPEKHDLVNGIIGSRRHIPTQLIIAQKHNSSTNQLPLLLFRRAANLFCKLQIKEINFVSAWISTSCGLPRVCL